MESAKKEEQEEEDEKSVKTFDGVVGSRDCNSISKTEFVPLMEAMGTDYCE